MGQLVVVEPSMKRSMDSTPDFRRHRHLLVVMCNASSTTSKCRRYALLDTLAGQATRALAHPASHPGLPNMLRRPRPGDTEVPEVMAA